MIVPFCKFICRLESKKLLLNIVSRGPAQFDILELRTLVLIQGLKYSTKRFANSYIFKDILTGIIY